MLAVRNLVAFAPAMLKRCLHAFLPALAVMLTLFLASGESLAQRVIDAPNIQAPSSPSIQMPPPEDPDPPPPSYYDAATGVSISAPSTMAPGSTAYVTVTIRNSGTTTWYPGMANPYRLGSQNPQDNTTWGVGRVELGSTVAPGGNAVFGFTITAPSTPGTYAFGWAMLREGMYWFGGNIASSITVVVPPPVYDAQLISTSVPSSMTAGSYYNVSMTLKNTGNTTWTSPDFLLANTDDNYTFGPNRVAMSPSTVVPGQSSTFNFQVRAPSTVGSYTFQWGMVWEYHQRFGQNSTTYITVSAPAPVTPRPTISVSRPALTAGQSFTSSWSTTDATSLTHVCTSSGTGYTVNESLAVNGSRALTAQSAWVGYPSSCTWTASGAGGSATYTETMTTVAAAVDGSVTYVHTDGLGSPVAKTDSNGTVISRTRYEPYGYVASGDQPTIGFTGHVNDADTGLTYMQQRYYDPVAGRFLSIDPVVADANTGDSFNQYAYVSNNPYSLVDPDGREEQRADAEAERQIARNAKEMERLCGTGQCSNVTTVQARGVENNSWGSYLPGTAAGENAAQYWADLQVQTGNDLYAIPGVLASLWTPDTAISTAVTLGGVGAGGAIAKAAGPLKQWIRIGPSYSRAGGFPVSMSIRWGASPARGGAYLRQIPSETMRELNQWLRSKSLPFGGWRSADPGHFHLWD